MKNLILKCFLLVILLGVSSLSLTAQELRENRICFDSTQANLLFSNLKELRLYRAKEVVDNKKNIAKDSVILMQSSTISDYRELIKNYDKNIESYKVINLQLEKTINKKRKENVILKTGLLILTGYILYERFF